MQYITIHDDKLCFKMYLFADLCMHTDPRAFCFLLSPVKARIQTEELRLLLDQHGWTGTAFSQRLDLQCLLDQLKSSSDVCEDSCREGDENDELPVQHSDDSVFTSSASKRELQREMETQSFGHDFSAIRLL